MKHFKNHPLDIDYELLDRPFIKPKYITTCKACGLDVIRSYLVKNNNGMDCSRESYCEKCTNTYENRYI